MNDRRRFLARTRHFLRWTALTGAALGSVAPLHAASLTRAVISIPGPGNLLYLPVPLASKIGADHAEGLEFDIRYTGGGPQSLRAMLERNADFAAAGLSALALQRINGKPVVCIVAMTRVPSYVLLVRGDLKGKVRKVEDLRGRVIGVKGHVPGGRSTSQLFAEFALKSVGLRPDEVNYVSVGQAYDSQHAALATGTVDAIVGDEPFATRLIMGKTAFALVDYHDLDTTRKLLGGLFLNGMVGTRDDVVNRQPELAEKVVRTMKRTLVWLSTHTADEVVDALAPTDPEERANLLNVLKLRKNIYTPDGRISEEQLDAVARFLRATEDTPAARAFTLRSAVDARWAGSAP